MSRLFRQKPIDHPLQAILGLRPVRLILQTADGKPIPGLTLRDCKTVFGDSIDRQVTWDDARLSEWSSKPVRIHFEMKECDLYSFQFE